MIFIRRIIFVAILCVGLGYTPTPFLQRNGADDTKNMPHISGIFIDAPAPEGL